MRTDDLDYPLPPAAIAQEAAEPRDAARLLIDGGPGNPPCHGTVRALPGLVRPGDVWVLNTTRVLPARLRLRKPTGAAVEVLLVEPVDGDLASRRWEALVRPSRRVAAGTVLAAGDELSVEVGDEVADGRREVVLHLHRAASVLDALSRVGEVPLPPYVTTPLADPERYQTTYGDRPGSVAAPTAGLHLTAELLDRIRDAGATVAPVELVVGPGTFRPITAEQVADHVMHRERYRVPELTLAAVDSAERVVAVGTTSLRALESAVRTGELEGATDLFIHGDDRVRSVDALLTNLHQPRSTLLALVEAFVGTRWRALYDEALAAGYRFLSLGDATWLVGRRGEHQAITAAEIDRSGEPEGGPR